MLAALLDGPPSWAFVRRVQIAHVILGTLTIAAVALLCARLVGRRWALLPALLTALSPHLVNLTVYVLTETLFTLALVVVCIVASVAGWWKSWRSRADQA